MKRTLTAVLLALLYGPALPEFAQAPESWVLVPMRTADQKGAGFAGGEMGQMAFSLAISKKDPTRLAMGLDTAGIYMSLDGGATWQIRRTGIKSNGVNSVTFDPENADVLFAAGNKNQNIDPYYDTAADGIYRSTDSGVNWQRVYQAAFQRSAGQNEYFAFDAPLGGRSRTILALADDQGLVKSTDGGDTWAKVSTAPAYGSSHALLRAPANGTLWLAGSGGLWRSTDSGVTWTKMAAQLPAGEVWGLALHPSSPAIVYAALGQKGIWRTGDGGAAWKQLVKGLPSGADWRRLARGPGSTLWADAAQPPQNSFYPYYTNDEGGSWRATTTGRDGYYPVKSFSEGLVAHPSNGSIAFVLPEVRRTTDGGRTWPVFGTGISGSRRNGGTSSIAVNGSKMMFFHTDWGASFTSDGGNTWQWRPGPPNLANRTQPGGAYEPIAGSKKIISAVGTHNRQELIMTTDDGATWQIIDPTVREYRYFAWHPQNAQVVYAAYSGGTRRSLDGGKTWSDLAKEVMAIFRANGDIVYSLSVMNGVTTVYESTNRGTDWAQVGGTFAGGARALDVDPRDSNRIYAAAGNGIWVYDGVSWNQKTKTNGLATNFFGGYNFESIAANPAKPGVVLAGGRISFRGVAQGVFRSTDHGQSWQNLNLNLGNDLTVWALSFSPDGTAWLGTDHGNFRLAGNGP